MKLISSNTEQRVSFWKPIILLSLLALTAGAIWVSCNGAGGSLTDELLPGDTNNANYQASSTTIESFAFNNSAFDYLDIFGDELGAPASVPRFGPRFARVAGRVDTILSFSLAVDSINWWYIFSAYVQHGNDTASVIDSIQYRTWGAPRPALDEDTVDEVRTRVHFVVIAHPDVTPVYKATGTGPRHERFEGQWAGWQRLDLTNLNQAQITANLTGADSVTGVASDDSARSCDIDVRLSKAATDVVIDTANSNCPLSGSMSAGGSLTLGCSGPAGTLTFGGSWNASVVFHGDVQNWVFVNNTTRWERTTTCTPEGSVAGVTPLGSLSALVNAE